jgi:hypothetical protein
MNMDELTDMIAQMGIEMEKRREEIVEATDIALALRSDFDELISMVCRCEQWAKIHDYAELLKQKWG